MHEKDFKLSSISWNWGDFTAPGTKVRLWKKMLEPFLLRSTWSDFPLLAPKGPSPVAKSNMYMRVHRITIGSKLSSKISSYSIQEESFSYEDNSIHK